MKRIWIALAGLAAVLAVFLVVMGLASPAKHIKSSDEESLYPYEYELTAKGLEVHISGRFPEEYHWAAVSESAEIRAAEKRQTDRKAVFLLTADGSAQGTVRFNLQKESGGLTGQSYEIVLSLLASPQGELRVLSNSHREITGLGEGSGEGFTYQAADQTDGTVTVLLHAEESMEWVPEIEGTSVRVSLDTAAGAENDCVARIEYAQLGQSWVRLCAGETGQAVELYVSTDLEERVNLIRHEVISYTAAQQSVLEQYEAEFASVYGTVALPGDALGVERAIVDWEDGESVGYLGFLLSGCRWEMYLLSELPADWCKAPGKAVETTIGETPVRIGAWGAGSSAVWLMDENICLLRCDEADSETLHTVAEQVITAVQHG